MTTRTMDASVWFSFFVKTPGFFNFMLNFVFTIERASDGRKK